MTRYLAVFPSLNQVALVKRALLPEGVYVDMTRTPQCLSSTGCSFALRCSKGELGLLRKACVAAHIRLGGIFEEDAGTDGPVYRLAHPSHPADGREAGS
jgi:hypothetical protein